MSATRVVVVTGWMASLLAAQGAAPKNEAELDKQVAQMLVTFARRAEANKVPSAARRAFEQILDHYDSENAAAFTGLGWKRVKGAWQQVTPADQLPADTANDWQKKTVREAWATAGKRIGALHRQLGLALLAAEEGPRGRHQLERALAFVPDDQEAHRALGHEEFDGFSGSAEQIAFVRRMRALLATAAEIAAAEIEVEVVGDGKMPSELRKTTFAFVGARTAHVTCWVIGDEEEARQCAIWNERGLRLMQFLVGDDPELRKYLLPRPVQWIAVLREESQRGHLLRVSPACCGDETLERALLLGGQSFKVSGGRAEWAWRRPENDADFMVAHATKRGTPWFNPGLSEGLVHTATWLLCGSMRSSYMNLPTTVGERDERSTEPAVCLRALRDDVEAGRDWQLVQVARERMANFRSPVRYKSWTFVFWLMARHPDQWVRLLVELGHEARMPEDVAKIFESVLGRSVGEVEAEWREWVRRDSTIGKASGLPQ